MNTITEPSARRLDTNVVGTLVAYSILYYDYLLTLNDEVRYIWVGQRGPCFVLYFLNRYGTLLGSIPLVVQPFVDWTSKECYIFHIYRQIYIVFILVVAAGILILRTYALYERNRTMLLILLANAGIVTASGLRSIVLADTDERRVNIIRADGYCSEQFLVHAAARSLIPWIGILLEDSVIFLLTLRKTLTHWRLGFVQLLLRDGIFLYFSLVVINLANILNLTLTQVRLDLCSYTAVSAVLVSRMVLNIRQFNPQPGVNMDRFEHGEMSTRITFTVPSAPGSRPNAA